MSDNIVNFTLNGKPTKAVPGQTILTACRKNGVFIPTLCFDERLRLDGSCRLCVVEVAGARTLVPACATELAEGMTVLTHSAKVIKARRDILMLLLSDHPKDCLACDRNGSCLLQTYCRQYGIDEFRFGWLGEDEHRSERDLDDSNPFFTIDRRLCILCGKCVRICNELMGVGAISMGRRGHQTVVSTPCLEDINIGRCVSCGNCVSNCPTGALSVKKQPDQGLDLSPEAEAAFFSRAPRKVSTTCPYCGVGCQMDLVVKGNRVIGVEPLQGVANNGLLCVKGKFGHRFLGHADRLKSPLIKRDGRFEEVSWDEALAFIKERAEAIKKKYGGWRFAGLSSACCTNEESYLMQKLARVVFKTNDIDHCARLCHSSTVAGLAKTLGSGAMTNSIEEVLRSEVVFIIGSNTSEAHPVIGAHIRQAQMTNNTKVIVADPRKIDMANTADIYLPIKAGSNIAILNALMKVIFDEKLYDQTFIEAHTENFEAMAEHLARLDFEAACAICGVNPEDVRQAARMYATAKTAGIYYSMGVTQFASGTSGVMSVSNLALLCGQLGKESAGVNPLRGQNNVQGACDMGALPNVFPGYQPVTDPAVRAKFEQAWQVTGLDDQVGLTLTQMMELIDPDHIRFLYIMGENPMVSDPDSNHIKKSLSGLELLVVQDIFLTETAELADVVLPAAAFAEKEGTFTNTERRVQLIRKAVKAPGQSLPDWRILVKVMRLFGYDSPEYRNASEIFDEMRALTPSYAGMTHERLDNLAGLQWPCPNPEHPGTRFLHRGGQFTRGKGLFQPIDYSPPAEPTDQEYPLALSTGRNLYQYHTRTMTGKVEGLTAKAGEGYVEIGPNTAAQYGIEHGDLVRVSSPRGSIEVQARILPRVRDGLIFVPFHYGEDGANMLTAANLDPICRIPEFKVSKVRIEKLAGTGPEKSGA